MNVLEKQEGILVEYQLSTCWQMSGFHSEQVWLCLGRGQGGPHVGSGWGGGSHVTRDLPDLPIASWVVVTWWTPFSQLHHLWTDSHDWKHYLLPTYWQPIKKDIPRAVYTERKPMSKILHFIIPLGGHLPFKAHKLTIITANCRLELLCARHCSNMCVNAF